MKRFLPALCLVLLATAAPAMAEDAAPPAMDHSKMGHGSAAAEPATAEPAKPKPPGMEHTEMSHGSAMSRLKTMNEESKKRDIYAPAMEKMHKDMMVTPTGDADADFVRGMIPHHQGAIDMAKILKEKGKDPELQKLADGIIAAQETEIAFMKEWLAKHPQ